MYAKVSTSEFNSEPIEILIIEKNASSIKEIQFYVSVVRVLVPSELENRWEQDDKTPLSKSVLDLMRT